MLPHFGVALHNNSLYTAQLHHHDPPSIGLGLFNIVSAQNNVVVFLKKVRWGCVKLMADKSRENTIVQGVYWWWWRLCCLIGGQTTGVRKSNMGTSWQRYVSTGCLIGSTEICKVERSSRLRNNPNSICRVIATTFQVQESPTGGRHAIETQFNGKAVTVLIHRAFWDAMCSF